MLRSGETPPIPPVELADRALASRVGNDHDRAYLELGGQTKEQIVRMLPPEWSFAGKRVLDFGSGAGRTLRHFRGEAREGEFWGADIHEASVEWMQENIAPPFHTWLAAEFPPLGLPHGSFDLIYTVSVFTHLAEGSLPWLLELRRLLKPDGLLIVSYMGRWSSEWFAKEPWVEDRVGMNVLFRHRPWESGGPAVLMSDWWIKEHWGRAFELLSTSEQFHNFSWVLMRKKAGEFTTDDLERPSDDPREIAALKHNILQLQREERIEIDYALEMQALHYERKIAELRRRIDGAAPSGIARLASRARSSLRSRLKGR